MAQWLGLHSRSGGAGVIPGWGTKVLQAAYAAPRKGESERAVGPGGCAWRERQSLGPGGGAGWKRHRMWRPPGGVTTAHPRRGEEHVDPPSRVNVALGPWDHLGERTVRAALPAL